MIPDNDELHKAAKRVVTIWLDAPVGVSFGSYMEDAIAALDIVLQNIADRISDESDS